MIFKIMVHVLHTLIAIFLSLFMAENCIILVKTAECMGSSGATPSTCTHGCAAIKNQNQSKLKNHKK